MARRAGKAASRKARQRRVQRPAAPASQPAAPTSVPAEEAAPSVAAPSVAVARRGTPARPSLGSQLTATERSEYHYVERDMRDIGILSVVMAALLAVSYVAVHTLGLLA